jgi:hypothetical protein
MLEEGELKMPEIRCNKCQKVMGFEITGEPNTSPRYSRYWCNCGKTTKWVRVR